MKRSVYIILILLIIGGTGYYAWNNRPLEVQQTLSIDQVTLLNPEGPTVIPVAGLAGGQVKGEPAVNIHYWKTNDEAIALLASGEAEFAVLPVTAAANIYASGVKIVLMGVHEWKVFYLTAAEGAAFDGWASLRGKQVYLPVGQGSTVDVLLRAALSGAGLVPAQDVDLVYSPPQEIVALFKSGKIEYGALPEPFASLATAGGNGRIAADFQEYWARLSNGQERLPIAGLFGRQDFLQQYPAESAQVAELFAESTAWSNRNVDAALSQSAEILPIPAPVMKEALARIDFTYVPIAECQAEVDYFLAKMQELYPDSIKQMPHMEFYAR